MAQKMEDEIRAKLLNTWSLYKTSKKSTNDCPTYRLNARLFQFPTSTSTRPSVNFVQSSMPPPPLPPPRKSIPSQFDKTKVIGKVRECQLCDRTYGNKRHQSLFREKNICCICRRQFVDEPALIQHVQQRIKSNICCSCNLVLSDDPETKEKHLKRHKLK